MSNFDSQGSRRVYNVGGHQSSLLAGSSRFQGYAGGAEQQNQDHNDDLSHLTRSHDQLGDSLQNLNDQRLLGLGVQKKLISDPSDRANTMGHQINQKFDSVSQSHDHDQRNSQAFDSNLSQTHQVRRSDSEFIKNNQQFFQTQKREGLTHMRSDRAPLDRIDENRSIQSRSGSRSRHLQGTGINPLNTSIASNNRNDLSIISQSNRLEESVKNPNRPPTNIQGLTEFLVDEHYKKTGVFSKTYDSVFNFWKKYVSEHYKISKKEKSYKFCKITSHSQFCQVHNPQLQPYESKDPRCTCPIKHERPAGPFICTCPKKTVEINETYMETSFKKEKTKIKKSEKEKTYDLFSKLYELDVAFTIKKDLEEEEIKYRAQMMKKEQDEKIKYEQRVRDAELSEINMMLQLYFDDMKDYLIRQMESKYEKENQASLNPKKNWHKKQVEGKDLSDTLDVKESVDMDRKEPKKPFIKEEVQKEKEKIEKDIEKELNFMKSLFQMVREHGMTNDPQEIFKLYQKEKEKARLGVIWAKGDDDVNRLIVDFCKPEKFLKRLTIYYGLRNRQNQIKHLSLFGFYQQIKKKEKLLNFIDWKEIRKNKKKDDSREEIPATTSIEGQLTFENSRNYSVEEIIEEYEKWRREQDEIERHRLAKEQELREQRRKEKLLEDVLGKDRKLKLENELKSKKQDTRLEELAKPKDKWKRGRILMELKKKFPHDPVLERMIKEEFKENRIFKYPEEYDLFDDEEDRLCKVVGGEKGLRERNNQVGNTLKEKFKALDDQELYYLNQKLRDQRRDKREFEQFILEKVHKYLELKKSRLQGQEETMRQFLSKAYHELKEKFPKLTEEKYPHITYGTKKDSETFKKSYPNSFKKSFFQIVKSFVRVRGKGLKRLRNAPPTFILPGGKRCHMHQYTCPEDCQYTTLNQKVLLKKNVTRRHQKDPKSFRSRVWRRTDFKKALNSVFMLSSDMANCTYEPEANSLSKNIDTAIRANPNFRTNQELFKETSDPDEYFKKLGKNFETSHPEVYKLGVLKRAKLKFMNGKFEEAMTALQDGFNIMSIRKRYDPNFMKWFMAEEMLKKRREREAQNVQTTSSSMTMFDRIQSKKDQPDSQKKKPEEDFENKKLLPVLREAFDLLMMIEKRKKDAQKKIKAIQRTQNHLERQVRGFSTFKKSQTRIDFSKGEKVLFRTIMCPLRDKCNKDKRPRWPTSSTKSITKFGQECPFAHHPMELKFPESILTQLSSSHHTIKNIQMRIDEEKPKQVFRPAGGLFNCVGCNNRSGKHMGGPCNLCRYKEMADEESKKFTDPKRKNSLMRSMERRESAEVKEDKKEMKIVMEKLDLDNNYTIKFGLFKKACVLHFYGRYNDAFDQIAKAAEIVQQQKQVEYDKQRILEKRWRFKLGLDEGFELPIPIEQIDPKKVDEKFLKKMDLQGSVQLSTLKLYIEQVHPNKSEEFSKHTFLNKLIEDNYLEFEAAIQDKLNTITKMKKQVEKLDEEADLMEAMGSGQASSPSPEKQDPNDQNQTMKKPKKQKMCQQFLKEKKCDKIKVIVRELLDQGPKSTKQFVRERIIFQGKVVTEERELGPRERFVPNERINLCQYSHNAICLDLITSETRMKNLNSVISSQTHKIKNMKPLEPWRPAKSGDIEHTHLMDMTSKKRTKGTDDENEDEEEGRKKEKMKKSIFERDNLFKKPYDTNE